MQQAERGYSHRMPQFNDNMRDHGLVVKFNQARGDDHHGPSTSWNL